ncbi:RiPP maturation radical SAM protein 1 [Actinoplanes sp. NBRC 14428]|uniref:Ribosomal peptide maturation radical SAM protein 1 n=1 Tax=Pseudosporangium ferrugineum TaxID=439699 RepID=A0A2T0RLF3_9ACTN|nr:RiPP maturation radical SAM C-methyltransferase [Pseudosporangium ferrugineum]PRY22026.1 ribosomal peptide maturation radical SAM protein 1 [Pseudosporangium ferrugineum]BCJ50698.1 RiPP maturation radical SAM protein 1 [Actinoplanes sp. NBRC 14428]
MAVPPGPGAAAPQRHASWPVVLVSMPFMAVYRPSIQIGLLKAIAERHGFPAATLHANLDLAALIGPDYYTRFSEPRGRMLGDWLFSVAAFGDAAPDPDGAFVDRFAAELAYVDDNPERLRKRLLHTREQVIPDYLDALADEPHWEHARVAAFSSTYYQNAASFALARRLKQRFPHLVTVFGGANFDDEMGLELVRSVDCVDLAVIGEGDTAFPRLLAALAAGTDPAEVPGVARRDGGTVRATPPDPPRPSLDDLPIPDYSEYFARAERLGILPPAGRRNVWIPFESARGCWWGEKHHCTFCGLNGTSMRFRAKSPQRVLDELGEQARRHRSFRFEAVDNIIDPAYLTSLLPVLVERETGYEFFYEVKANLTRRQLKLFALAGLTRVQPGIESLSTHVLKLMRKGITAAQNVNTLRWAAYYGIDVSWNILWGFPGETADDYAAQARLLPHLRHLKPPDAAGRVWLERFSPLFTEREAFPLRSRVPELSYRYVYPEAVDLDRVAYMFEYDPVEALPPATYAELATAVGDWRAGWDGGARPALTYWSAPGLLQIYDERIAGQEGTYAFGGAAAEVYLACSDRPATAAGVHRRLGGRLPVPAVREAFGEFARRGLMFLDGERALSLALPAVRGR